ncbi:hypothetical protein MOQ_005635 [Trypanosoma cruzi marinkellei]|uniref:Uncharacterized protein n=1 Tax=Trypanosoma cruzi marinkellei TaxID=85056 RepID=K2NNZ3_TRYCR|nr:hypothetical protein MOQ_005635 [Trypanosoma cruzi marinkellei]
MEDAVTLSATLRRASPLTRHRALVILFAIRGLAKKGDMTLSLTSITTALEFSMAGRPVRFLFATGGHASVLRSHDRGGTWRIAYRVKGTSNDHMEGVPPSDKMVTMEDIARLLPSSESAKGQKWHLGTDCSATELKTQLSHVTALDSMVAVCGSNAFLAVSVDRGMSFLCVKEEDIHSCMKDEPSASCESWQIEGVAFLSEQLLMFYSKNSLFSIELIHHHHKQKQKQQQQQFGVVAFGRVRLVKRFAVPVGCLKTFSQNGKFMCELFVSTKGDLHYSSDGGQSFLTFPHKIGTIRAIEPLDIVLRRREVPQLPSVLLTHMQSAATEDTKSKKTGKYIYRAISRHDSVEEKDNGEQNMVNSGNWALTGAFPYCSENVHYRVFLVGGIGTSILPYDYTALFFIAATLNDSTGRIELLGSLAESVDYIPYIRSGAAEPTSIALCRRPGSKGCVFARSNASGVSLSSDMGRSWTTPTQAYTVAVVAMDGGEFVCCNRRNVVSNIHGGSREVYSIPADLRVPYLTDAAVML